MALIATACSVGQDADVPLATTTTTAPDASVSGAAGVIQLFDPVFEQVDCPGDIARPGLACGVVEVLLDSADVDLGTTEISIATLAGSEAGTPAVAVLQGGPGGASTDLAAWLPVQPFTQVFIDQRGTGFAAADLDCPEWDAALPTMLEAPADEVDPIGDAALAVCARRLGDDSRFAHTTSATHADDVTSVMLGLGHVGGWFAYGVSYGSTIAMELLRDERPGLEAVVLDGVYPLTLDLDSAIVDSARSSVSAITATCAADERCAGWTPDFGSALDDLVRRLDDEPMLVRLDASDSGFDTDVEVVLDGRRLAELTFLLLYSEASIAGLPAAIRAIGAGDERATRWLVSTASRTLAASYRANDEGTYFAVQCAERVPVAGGIDASADGFANAVVTVSLAASCEPWPVEPLSPGPLLAPIRSELPVLLLSGTFDPITPPAYAASVAASLDHATVVVQQGRSHGIWIGNDCVQGIVSDFIASAGSVTDTTCADKPVPVNWFDPG